MTSAKTLLTATALLGLLTLPTLATATPHTYQFMTVQGGSGKFTIDLANALRRVGDPASSPSWWGDARGGSFDHSAVPAGQVFNMDFTYADGRTSSGIPNQAYYSITSFGGSPANTNDHEYFASNEQFFLTDNGHTVLDYQLMISGLDPADQLGWDADGAPILGAGGTMDVAAIVRSWAYDPTQITLPYFGRGAHQPTLLLDVEEKINSITPFTSAVPEPGQAALMLAGGALLALGLRRRRGQASA